MISKSGIGTYIKNIIPYLIKDNRFDCKIILHTSDVKPLYICSESIIGFTSSIYSIREQYEFLSKIEKCDIFWSPHYNVPIFPIKAKQRIVTIHDMNHMNYFFSLKLREKIYLKTVLKRCVKLSDKIITVSSFSKSEILKYMSVKPDKISVIYNGVKPGKTSIIYNDVRPVQNAGFTTRINTSNLISESNVKPRKTPLVYSDVKLEQNTGFTTKINKPYFLFVGNVKPHKNLKMIVLAFKKLIKTNDCKLVVIGTYNNLKNHDEKSLLLINNDPLLKRNVIFLENVSDYELEGYYKNALALLNVSYYEGFGLTGIEAMSFNTPVIASDIEVFKEIYSDNVMYVNPYSYNDIYNAMMTIFTDPLFRQKMIEKSKNFAEKYSWETSAKKHMEIFDEICCYS